jgi:hypothetical protein
LELDEELLEEGAEPMRNLFRHVAGATLLGVAGLMLTAPATADPNLDQILEDQVNLSGYTIQEFVLPDQPGMPFEIQLNLGGLDYTLFMQPKTVRQPGFRVLVDDGNGELNEVMPPISRTYQGELDQVGSLAAGSLLETGFKGVVYVDAKQGGAFYVQPLSEILPDAPRSQHIVYGAEDSLWRGWDCGVPDGDAMLADDHAIGGGGNSTRELLVCEIACDADYNFYQRNGSNLQNTINDVENVIAGVNVAYERDVELTHSITTIIVRTSLADNPYTTNDPGNLLDQFRSVWRANHGDIQRDIAHLFTGRNINGGVIGIAWLSAICSTNNGYGLVESRFTSNYNQRVALSAHELGHNWSAQHCDSDGSRCHIMCSGLGGCGGIGNPPFFGTRSQNAISSYASTRPCLDSGNTNTVDLTWIASTAEASPGETVTLELWAAFDPPNTGVASSVFEIIGTDANNAGTTIDVTEGAGDNIGNFLGRRPTFRGPGTSPPFVVGNDDITAAPSGVDAYQFPVQFNPDFDPANPVVLFRFEWSTSDGTERTVSYNSQHGNFDVYIDDLGQSESYGVTVHPTSFNIVPGPDCPPDFNGDGVVNSQDFVAFLNAFVAGDPSAPTSTTTVSSTARTSWRS